MFRKQRKFLIVTTVLFIFLSLSLVVNGPIFGLVDSARAANVGSIDTAELLDIIRPTSDDRTYYDEVPTDWDLAIIDTRSQAEYEAGHINGAINLPADGDFLPCPFPADMDTKMVFYGDSPTRWAEKTLEEGYSNVYIYEAGIEEWKTEADYLTTTPQYVSGLIDADYVGNKDNPPYTIIDTRGFGMYLESHIPTAQSMEHTIFEDKFLDYMPPDKDMEIITYCGGFF